MSHLYHIRITIRADTPEIYKTYFEQKTVKHLLVQENPDEDCKQVHLHAMFTCFHKNDQAVRREMRSWFPDFSGNKTYSIKVGTEPGGWHYICKGPDPNQKTFPIVVSTTETNEDITKWHEEYWSVRQSRNPIKSDVVVNLDEPIEKKKIKTKTWTVKLIEQLTVELTHGEVKYADVHNA